MANYTVQKIFKWFEQFDKTDIKIEGENLKFQIEIKNSILPHLLGLQYTQERNNNELKGIDLFADKKEKFLSDEEILEEVANVNPSSVSLVEKKIKSLKYALENLEKFTIVERTYNSPNSTLLSDYFLKLETKFGNKNSDTSFLHIGILKGNSEDYFETFFDREDDKYFKKTTISEKIVSIKAYDKELNCYKPFTFKDKNTAPMFEIYENASLKDKIATVNWQRLKHYDKSQENHFVAKVNDIIQKQVELENQGLNRLSFDYIKEKIPIIEKIEENISIKHFFKELDEYDLNSSKEKNANFIKKIKSVLNLQLDLDEKKANLYSRGETFKKVNNFFRNILDEKDIKQGLKRLEELDFPINYINSFKIEFKEEIYGINKTKKTKPIIKNSLNKEVEEEKKEKDDMDFI